MKIGVLTVAAFNARRLFRGTSNRAAIRVQESFGLAVWNRAHDDASAGTGTAIPTPRVDTATNVRRRA
jgi:hypothetical protein